MKKCFDAGEIQAFLDGELSANAQETVARHVAACDACALLLSEAEEENVFAFAALEREFNGAPVPTNRLWTKINRSIERENNKPARQTIFEIFKNLFANPLITAFAGLLIVAGIFTALRNSGTSENAASTARKEKSKFEIVLPPQAAVPENPFAEKRLPQIEIAAAKNSPFAVKANEYRAVRANFVKEESGRNKRGAPVKSAAPKNIAPEFVSGEANYIKTIASLEKTVESRKDEVLKPAARFSFEKDLAISDDAIAKMKREVRRNPQNAAAKQILLASYQNKVELLNSVAEKTELMASLK